MRFVLSFNPDVCLDMYIEDLTTLTSMIDLLSTDVVELQMSVDGLSSTVNTQYAGMNNNCPVFKSVLLLVYQYVMQA